MKLKHWIPIALVAAIGCTLVEPVSAARRVVVRRGRPAHHRTVVVVRTGHPIRRALPVVVVRPARIVPRVAVATFLPLVVWAPVAVARPDHDWIAWEDGETFYKEEDWTEITLNADARGEKLFVEVVKGKVQLDFAEVVFENGDCQVVDFNNGTRGMGVYSLLDFRDGRKVDHVRVIAKAKSDEARIVLLMRK